MIGWLLRRGSSTSDRRSGVDFGKKWPGLHDGGPAVFRTQMGRRGWSQDRGLRCRNISTSIEFECTGQALVEPGVAFAKCRPGRGSAFAVGLRVLRDFFLAA